MHNKLIYESYRIPGEIQIFFFPHHAHLSHISSQFICIFLYMVFCPHRARNFTIYAIAPSSPSTHPPSHGTSHPVHNNPPHKRPHTAAPHENPDTPYTYWE